MKEGLGSSHFNGYSRIITIYISRCKVSKDKVQQILVTGKYMYPCPFFYARLS